jgi:hypothetical protein
VTNQYTSDPWKIHHLYQQGVGKGKDNTRGKSIGSDPAVLIKGFVSRDEYFFDAYNIKNEYSEHALIIFTICLFRS